MCVFLPSFWPCILRPQSCQYLDIGLWNQRTIYAWNELQGQQFQPLIHLNSKILTPINGSQTRLLTATHAQCGSLLSPLDTHSTQRLALGPRTLSQRHTCAEGSLGWSLDLLDTSVTECPCPLISQLKGCTSFEARPPPCQCPSIAHQGSHIPGTDSLCVEVTGITVPLSHWERLGAVLEETGTHV